MGTHHKGPEKERLALNTYVKMMRALNSVNAWLHDEYRRYGVSENQFAVMEVLYHLGPLCLTDLSDKMVKFVVNLSEVVDDLAKSGFVESHRGKNDKGYVLIFLTRSGKEKIEKHLDNHIKSITSLFKVLSIEEQHQLSALSKKLGRGIPDKHPSSRKKHHQSNNES